MTHRKLSHLFLLPAFALGVLAGCGGGGGDDEGGSGSSGIASIQITPEDIVLAVDMQQALAATAFDADGNAVNATFKWAVSDTDVAITDANGTTLTGITPGNALLEVSAGGKSAQTTVTVVERVESKLVTGTRHSCGLTITGEAWCWGSNGYNGVEEFGVLGNENAGIASALPVRVQGGLLFKDIAAGNRHTCGITTDGKAYCWGKNDYGQLGTDAVTGMTYTPVPVEADATFESISTANLQTCALTETGETWCWPFAADTWWNPPDVDTPPILLPYKLDGVPPLIDLGLGNIHACGITADGEAWCWGNNYVYGLLGINSAVNEAMTPVQVVGGHVFSALSVGSATTCALEDGRPWCWGNGMLPDFGHAYQPTAIGTDTFVTLNVAHGPAAYALDAQGDLYWWGARAATCGNTTGEHGCETDPANWEFVAETPELLDSQFDHVALSVGSGAHSMSITADGRITGWGANQLGEAGLGTTDIWWQRNPARPLDGFTLAIDATRVTLEAGESTSVPVTVTRLGGFSIYGGAGFDETITFTTLYLPSGVTGTFVPATLSGSLTETTLVLTAADNAAADMSDVSVQASAPGATMQQAEFELVITQPAGDGELNLVCESADTVLPSGYHCMDNGAGNIAPGKYDIPAMHGIWVDEEIGLCLRWGENGDATARFRAPELGGGSTEVHEGLWGVLVRSTGEPEGTATQWYVFTEPADDQTKLLGYDAATNQIIGWNFEKSATCPW